VVTVLMAMFMPAVVRVGGVVMIVVVVVVRHESGTDCTPIGACALT
jgi:hypothetical protein